MITLKIKVNPEAEDVLTNSLMGRGQSFNLEDEEWDEDEGVLTVLLDGDDTTSAVELGLNTNPDVLEWWTEE